MDKTNDIGIELNKETIEKIKAAAAAKAEASEVADDEIGSPAEDTKDLKPVEPESQEQIQRRVFFEPKVKIEVHDSEKLVDTLYADRNILEIGLIIKALSDDKLVSIYAIEDKAASDPLPEGAEEPEYPIFDIVKKPVREAFITLGKQVVPETACMIEFQRLCEFMSFRSTLRGANIVLTFKGNQPGGFSYFSSCVTPDQSVYTALYNATAEQNKQYKAKVKEAHPEIRFDDDSNIITHL